MSLINHSDLAESKLATQFKEAINLINFIRTLLSGADELEQVFYDLLLNRSIDTAVGVQLDIIGAIVGIPRPFVLAEDLVFFGFQGIVGVGAFGDTGNPALGGLFRGEAGSGTGNTLLDDTQYRLVIKTKIIKNSASGTIEDIISAADTLLDVDTITITELISATENEVQITFDRALSSNEVILLTELSLIPKPIGVRLNYIP